MTHPVSRRDQLPATAGQWTALPRDATLRAPTGDETARQGGSAPTIFRGQRFGYAAGRFPPCRPPLPLGDVAADRYDWRRSRRLHAGGRSVAAAPEDESSRTVDAICGTLSQTRRGTSRTTIVPLFPGRRRVPAAAWPKASASTSRSTYNQPSSVSTAKPTAPPSQSRHRIWLLTVTSNCRNL